MRFFIVIKKQIIKVTKEYFINTKYKLYQNNIQFTFNKSFIKMINLKHLIENPEIYKEEMGKRSKDKEIINQIISLYNKYKADLLTMENLRQKVNKFSKNIWNISKKEKENKLIEMKKISNESKIAQEKVSTQKKELDELIKKIPNISRDWTPIWKTDNDNKIIKTFWEKPNFDFNPKHYRELEIYKKYVWQKEWTNAMWSRGFYLRWEMSKLQKVLFDYSLDYILQQWYELFYVPLMLNDKVLTGTWHLPDFEGQQYETKINDNTNYYLIWSSEPSIMWYFMNKDLWSLENPILVTCQSSCFRKESWSYWKDQQWILRVHQFEKIEMVVICNKEDAEKYFKKHAEINEHIRNELWLHYQKVEVCTWDMPSKHYRQQDYEARFPAEWKFREIGSNWNASDFQNRWLNINYIDENWNKQTPRWLNDTGMTFRTWLAILEQFQTKEWKIKIPKILQQRFGKEYIE